MSMTWHSTDVFVPAGGHAFTAWYPYYSSDIYGAIEALAFDIIDTGKDGTGIDTAEWRVLRAKTAWADGSKMEVFLGYTYNNDHELASFGVVGTFAKVVNWISICPKGGWDVIAHAWGVGAVAPLLIDGLPASFEVESGNPGRTAIMSVGVPDDHTPADWMLGVSNTAMVSFERVLRFGIADPSEGDTETDWTRRIYVLLGTSDATGYTFDGAAWVSARSVNPVAPYVDHFGLYPRQRQFIEKASNAHVGISRGAFPTRIASGQYTAEGEWIAINGVLYPVSV